MRQGPDVLDDVAALGRGEGLGLMPEPPFYCHPLAGTVDALGQQAAERGVIICERTLDIAGRLTQSVERGAMAEAAKARRDHAPACRLGSQVGRLVLGEIGHFLSGVVIPVPLPVCWVSQ